MKTVFSFESVAILYFRDVIIIDISVLFYDIYLLTNTIHDNVKYNLVF